MCLRFVNSRTGFLSLNPIIFIYPTQTNPKDQYLIWAKVEVNPCQTIEKLLTTQGHLQQSGETSRAGVRVPYNLSEENKANRCTG